ncbi:MAG TPA: hypothetical protein VGQ17_08510 [Gemmatimonadales bacterium]|jgi:hypothetical protein|nr:hypothetical protein [Gemmatimonadales bacterium]
MASPPRLRLAGPAVIFLALSFAGLIKPDPLNAAYIDPLSGSILLQVLAAGVFSLLFTMKRTLRWLGTRLDAIRNRLLRQ